MPEGEGAAFEEGVRQGDLAQWRRQADKDFKELFARMKAQEERSATDATWRAALTGGAAAVGALITYILMAWKQVFPPPHG